MAVLSSSCPREPRDINESEIGSDLSASWFRPVTTLDSYGLTGRLNGERFCHPTAMLLPGPQLTQGR